MKQNHRTNSESRRASALVASMIFTALAAIACFGLVGVTRYNYRKQHSRTNRAAAYFMAENAMLEAAQRCVDIGDAAKNTYTLVNDGTVTSANILPFTPPAEVKNLRVTIAAAPTGIAKEYLITSSGTVGGLYPKTRTLQALIHVNPPSNIFDHEYFLNNWGWWWGREITGNGDNRSNWDFDFRWFPTVNGHAFAAGSIASNLVPVDPFNGTPPFVGWAGDSPVTYAHVGSTRVNMPNLLDFTYYESKATGTIKKNGVNVVNGIHGDDEAKTGIYLEGTVAQPLVINGTVVIRGNAVLSGVITGKGTVYVGGTLYEAGDISYANPPNYEGAIPPTTMTNPKDRETFQDNWAAANQGGDLVAWAVRGNILRNQVNSSYWKTYCYDAADYGLKLCGREDNLGADGIRTTPDDGVPYKDTNGDGIPDSAAYDADEDGVIRTTNYDYATDLVLTPTKAAQIQGYPTNTDGSLKDYNNVASMYTTKRDGIFYTNHAFAQLSFSGPEKVRGILCSRDEAWVFSVWSTIFYDWRIHSRNLDNPNTVIDLGLPITNQIRFITREEIYPTS